MFLPFVWGSHTGSSIFQLWTDKSAICHLPHAWMFSFDISPVKVKGFVALSVTLSLWERQDINNRGFVGLP